MISDIPTIASALKSIADLIKLTGEVKVSSAVREKAIELQSIILSLQDENFSLQSENRELLNHKEKLEQEIAGLIQWNADAQRYELKEIATGVFAYAIKVISGMSEPVHYLCAHCYENRQRSTLQRTVKGFSRVVCYCPHCKFEAVITV